MKGIDEYLIQFEKTHYETTVVGGVEMDVNPYFEQPKWINRIGKVVATPILPAPDAKIKKGYEVLVVHTSLLHESYNHSGRKESFYCVDVENSLFRFEENLIFMYRESSDRKWLCNGKNVFIKPIPLRKEILTIAGLEVPDAVLEEEIGYKQNEKQTGIVAFANKELEGFGVKKGDKIYFKADREYEFEIDGNIYYHMENVDLLMVDKNE